MSGRWLTRLSPATGGMRLLGIPHAGGGLGVFRPWVPLVRAPVELWAAQPPGRESRLGETPWDDLGHMADALAAAHAELPPGPFALFGHSMGALLAFEMARSLRKAGADSPMLLIVAGHRPPHVTASEPPLHGLPDPDLLAALRRLGGLPPEMLEHTELVQLLLPALRADFAACETYRYAEGEPLDCPLLAIAGESDPLAPWPEISGWRRHTSGEFRSEVLPGDHFFIHTARAELLRLISAALAAPSWVGRG